MSNPRWRVGRKLGRTLYRDEVCVGMVDTPEIAKEIAAAMNGAEPSEIASVLADGWWGVAYLHTHGWHARGLTQRAAEQMVKDWEWHKSVPLLAKRDPDYARDLAEERAQEAPETKPEWLTRESHAKPPGAPTSRGSRPTNSALPARRGRRARAATGRGTTTTRT